MDFEFLGEVVEWRGPAPFVFVIIPTELSAEIKEVSALASYGWGCIPVSARIGETVFTTSIMPRSGVFLLPVKLAVQKSEQVKVGDKIQAGLSIKLSHR